MSRFVLTQHFSWVTTDLKSAIWLLNVTENTYSDWQPAASLSQHALLRAEAVNTLTLNAFSGIKGQFRSFVMITAINRWIKRRVGAAADLDLISLLFLYKQEHETLQMFPLHTREGYSIWKRRTERTHEDTNNSGICEAAKDCGSDATPGLGHSQLTNQLITCHPPPPHTHTHFSSFKHISTFRLQSKHPPSNRPWTPSSSTQYVKFKMDLYFMFRSFSLFWSCPSTRQ